MAPDLFPRPGGQRDRSAPDHVGVRSTDSGDALALAARSGVLPRANRNARVRAQLSNSSTAIRAEERFPLPEGVQNVGVVRAVRPALSLAFVGALPAEAQTRTLR